jgi:hypothetical protein
LARGQVRGRPVRGGIHQVIEQARVRGMIYGSSSGCRQISLFHKPHDRSSRADFPHLRASAASMPVQPGTPARRTAVNCNDEARSRSTTAVKVKQHGHSPCISR